MTTPAASPVTDPPPYRPIVEHDWPEWLTFGQHLVERNVRGKIKREWVLMRGSLSDPRSDDAETVSCSAGPHVRVLMAIYKLRGPKETHEEFEEHMARFGPCEEDPPWTDRCFPCSLG